MEEENDKLKESTINNTVQVQRKGIHSNKQQQQTTVTNSKKHSS